MKIIHLPETDSLIAYPSPFEFYANHFASIAKNFVRYDNLCHLHLGLCVDEQDLLFFLDNIPNASFIIYIHDAPFIARNKLKQKLTLSSLWSKFKNSKILFGVTFTKNGLIRLQDFADLKFIYLPHIDYTLINYRDKRNSNTSKLNALNHLIAGHINGYKGHLNLLASIVISNILKKDINKNKMIVVGNNIGLRGSLVKIILMFFTKILPSTISIHSNVNDEDFVNYILSSDFVYCIHDDEPGYFSSSGPASLALSFGKTVFFKSEYKFSEFKKYCPKLVKKYSFISSILKNQINCRDSQYYIVNHLYINKINTILEES